jgi:hypothetical protein
MRVPVALQDLSGKKSALIRKVDIRSWSREATGAAARDQSIAQSSPRSTALRGNRRGFGKDHLFIPFWGDLWLFSTKSPRRAHLGIDR